MADTDDPKPSKKTSISDLSETGPSTAPEFKGPGTKVYDEGSKEPDDPAPEDDNTPKEDTDPETDKAVDDIMKNDGDEALKSQDEKAVVMKTGHWERFKNGWADWWSSPRKRWGTIGVIVVALGVLGGVPYTRYTVAGLVLKGKVTVQAVDSKTGEPVSGATVNLGGVTAETDAAGKVTLQVNAGSRTLAVSKKYYTGVTQKELIALSGNTYKVKLVALGRQVTVKVVNKLTGKPVANAVVGAQGGDTKTKSDGTVAVVLPSNATTQEASVSLDGYNTAKVSIFAAGDVTKNTFSITPVGKLYFLSNLSGKIDVVKTNLDGSDRQTVLAGTGNEDRFSTSLLASRDWKYLALLAKRSGDKPSVYLIDTTQGDKLSTIDEGNAQFDLVGWSGDRFIYKLTRNGVQNWQPNAQALKSFDPVTGSTLLLDQTQGSGSDQYNYARQQLGAVYLMGDQVVYPKTWYGFGSGALINGKSSELDTIGADGSGSKTLKTFALSNAPGSGYINIDVSTQLYEPQGLHIAFQHDGTSDFYDYDDGKVTADSTMTADKYNQLSYATYLLSPSGNSTFWSDQRDGKSTLFTGDKDAKNQKQVISLSDYNTYGWYTDNYLLVSKNSSELYIMPASGGTPFKITDYYKPAINYQGYGGGYGGL